MSLTPPILFGLIGLVAKSYHGHELSARFAAGPRTMATVTKIYRHDKEHFWADVSFGNSVNGRDVQCNAPINAGRRAEGLAVGSMIEVAPKSGTCAEVASRFDQ